MKDKFIAWRSSHLSLALIAIFVAYFTVFFIASTINVALPRIAAELDGMSVYSWAISIPALASAFVTLIFGKLSDMYGRRLLLLVSMGFLLLGAGLSAVSQTFSTLIVTLSIIGLGQGAIQPLCFSALGDMFAPYQRSRWAGLLNIASGITAFIGPMLSGWFVDNLSWRYIFWIDLPLIILSALVILVGLPSLANRAVHKIDFRGAIYLAVATSAMILGFSWAGTFYPWGSVQVIGLLVISAISWVLFLRTEARAAEPMLDPKVLTNRTFITASLAALISLFGITIIMVYYSLFLQGVMNASATLTGKILTPYNVLASFMGIPAGLLIATTRRYKWMFVGGYAILVAVMWGMVALTAETSLGWAFMVSIVAGIGLGTIPTINALVVQYAVPKRLLGVATGGLYFFVSMGKAIAPAILGSAMNASYARELANSLPAALHQFTDKALLASLSNPRVLLSAPAMSELQKTFAGIGPQGPALLMQTVAAVRVSMETGLRTIFLVGAVTMLISFLLILTIPEIKLDEKEPL
jgi:MFS family permease